MIPPGALASIVGRDLAHAWIEHLEGAAIPAGINTRARLEHWLAQLLHESAGLKRLHENLNYTPDRLRLVWPHRFPTREAAERVAGEPRATANLVYGSRLGNRPGTNDGYTFRGRGLIHLTGRSNYRTAGAALGIPLEAQPELAADPPFAAIIAAWYWNHRRLSPLADLDDLEGITRAINGGLNGLRDRRKHLRALRTAWTATEAPVPLGGFHTTVLHFPRGAKPLVLGASVASRTPRPDGTTKLDVRFTEEHHG